MSKNILNREFSTIKLLAREIIIFPQKFKTYFIKGTRNRHKMIQNTYHGSKHQFKPQKLQVIPKTAFSDDKKQTLSKFSHLNIFQK